MGFEGGVGVPVKDSTIELGTGHLYFKGVDEPIEVDAGNLITTEEEEWADEVKHISLNPEPFTFECDAEFNNNWTAVKCKECGDDIPVTEFYAILYGTTGWTCPRCTFNKAIEEARKRSDIL